jgi:hypothetical protein
MEMEVSSDKEVKKELELDEIFRKALVDGTESPVMYHLMLFSLPVMDLNLTDYNCLLPR